MEENNNYTEAQKQLIILNNLEKIQRQINGIKKRLDSRDALFKETVEELDELKTELDDLKSDAVTNQELESEGFLTSHDLDYDEIGNRFTEHVLENEDVLKVISDLMYERFKKDYLDKVDSLIKIMSGKKSFWSKL